MISHPLLPPVYNPRASGSGEAAYKPNAFFVNSPIEHTFHPHSAVGNAVKATVATGSAGLLISTVQNALETHDKGALGVFTRTGSTISFLGECLVCSIRQCLPDPYEARADFRQLIRCDISAAVGFTYAFVQATSANIREVCQT